MSARCFIFFTISAAALAAIASPIRSSDGARHNIFVADEESPISPLPDGLVSIQYLESTGEQYIDTGLWSTEDTQLDCVMSEGDLTGLQYTSFHVTGNTINGYGQSWYYISYAHYSDGTWRWTGGRRYCDGSFLHCTMDQERNIYVDGEYVSQSCSQGYKTVESRYTKMYVFAYLKGSVITCGRFKIKRFKIKRLESVMIDLIPVRFLNEDGISEGGMYDLVSEDLFRNIGSGYFISGPDL